jgi:hypothetical protein
MASKLSREKTDDIHQYLLDSSNWMIIRNASDGLHLHMKDYMDWGLMAIWLSKNDEMYKSIVTEVNRLKKLK